MRYLVVATGLEPFLTEWFDIDNNYNPEYKMVVFDLVNRIYYDGNIDKVWLTITEDHL